MKSIDFRPFINSLSKYAHNSLCPIRVQGIISGQDRDTAFYSLNPYMLDAGKLKQSKALRRLAEKTQVFTLPLNSHVRNRLTHTLEVEALSVKIASILGLNIWLCEAIALGHDIGHTPFGHFGEVMISELTGRKFRHNVFGLTVANAIERRGMGLCLTRDTLLGMQYHSRTGSSVFLCDDVPLEYNVVALADKIAFTIADINDAIRFGYLSSDHDVAKRLGENQSTREQNCVHALVEESADAGKVSFKNSQIAQDFQSVRAWLTDNVYLVQNDNKSWHKSAYETVYSYISRQSCFVGHDPAIIIALMTDVELSRFFTEVAEGGKAGDNIDISGFGFSFMEILPSLQPGIDFTKTYC